MTLSITIRSRRSSCGLFVLGLTFSCFLLGQSTGSGKTLVFFSHFLQLSSLTIILVG